MFYNLKNKVYIISLGKIATWNGGLTNSAIVRAKIISENKKFHAKKIFITYCSEVQETHLINSFFQEKYNLCEKIEFMNFDDGVPFDEHSQVSGVRHPELKERYSGYILNGSQIEYSDYLTLCLRSLIDNLKENKIILFMDVPLTPDNRVYIRDKRVRKFYFLHSEHLKTSEHSKNWKSCFYKGRPFYQPIQDLSTNVICFTKKQLDFLSYREGFLDRFWYIPHYYESSLPQSKIEKKNLIVIISRLDEKSKKTKLAIDSFIDADIDYKLEIYGDGPDKSKLIQHVKSRGASNKVTFMGVTKNVDSILSRAKASINLTYNEGFCLSILESLANSCPVIASDVLYGPRELVSSGVNGFLVSDDKSEIIESIMKIINEYQYFSKKAFISSLYYSKKNYVKRLIEATSSEKAKTNYPIDKSIYETPIKLIIEKTTATIKFDSRKMKKNNISCVIRCYTQTFESFKDIDINDRTVINIRDIRNFYLSAIIKSCIFSNETSLIHSGLPVQIEKKKFPGKNNEVNEVSYIVIH